MKSDARKESFARRRRDYLKQHDNLFTDALTFFSLTALPPPLSTLLLLPSSYDDAPLTPVLPRACR